MQIYFLSIKRKIVLLKTIANISCFLFFSVVFIWLYLLNCSGKFYNNFERYPIWWGKTYIPGSGWVCGHRFFHKVTLYFIVPYIQDIIKSQGDDPKTFIDVLDVRNNKIKGDFVKERKSTLATKQVFNFEIPKWKFSIPHQMCMNFWVWCSRYPLFH